MEEENKKIIATESDIENFNGIFRDFTNTLSGKLRELHSLDRQELVALKDESQGLSIELQSRVIPADKLLGHAQKGFQFLKSERGNGVKPLGLS